MLALVLFSTLGQTCDDLVLGATAMLNSTGLGGFAFCRCATLPLSEGGRTTAGPKATKADVSLQARVPARVYSCFALMSIGFDWDRRDVSSQTEVCIGEQHGTAQPLCLRRVLATAATGLLTRSFHIKALLRDRVLPPMDGDEWICRIDRSGDSIRTRCRLAEADRRRCVCAVRQRMERPWRLMPEGMLDK
jgi:hypothetical protein